MNELTISLKQGDKVPLYEQIYSYIKEEIQKGAIPSGEKLPSTRALCRHLDVSRSTVELAYEQLLSEGYIESQPYRGYFVAEIEGLYQFGTESGAEEKKERTEEKQYKYDFTPNGVDLKSFPYNAWRKLSRECLTDDRAELFRLGCPQGEYGLRNAISSYLHQARGVNCTPDQIIVGAGNDYLLMLLCAVLGNRHRVALENPTYRQAYRLFENLSYEVCTVDMDSRGMRADGLEKSGADIAFVMPSHQYPLGTVMPIRRRMELLRWAEGSRNRYIIEDDYDSEFRLTGKPIPALQSIDLLEKVIYINTFSKSLTSTMRISYMVLPRRLAEEFQSRMSFYSCTVSNFEQYALMRFIREGYLEKHINRMRNYYHRQRDTLLHAIKKSPLSSFVMITEEDSGLHFLMKIDTGLSDTELTERARKKGLRLTALSRYYHRPSGNVEHIFIMNYSSLETEHIPEAIRRLYQCLAE